VSGFGIIDRSRGSDQDDRNPDILGTGREVNNYLLMMHDFLLCSMI